MTNEEFDAAVKALRGKVEPMSTRKKKADCTPEMWASHLDAGLVKQRRWVAANRERHRHHGRTWRALNPQKAAEMDRKWRSKNPEKVALQKKRDRLRHGDKRKRAQKAWNQKNRDGIRARSRERYASEPSFKMSMLLRNRLNLAVNRNDKAGSAVRDLGCTIEQLWAHLESRFQPGMTRENWGDAWEIDHVFPLSKADLTGSRVEFLAANNWRNLQPLTPEQNRIKGDTVTPDAQALFDRLKAEFGASGDDRDLRRVSIARFSGVGTLRPSLSLEANHGSVSDARRSAGRPRSLVSRSCESG